MKNKEVCNKIKETLSNEKDVLAIFHNGSSIVGVEDSASDLDFVVVLKDSKIQTKILNLLRKKFEVTTNPENPEIKVEEQFIINKRRADFTFVSKKDLGKKINNFYKSKKNVLENQHFIQHKIVDSVSVYDPEKLLKKYQKEIKKYPDKLFNEIFNDSIYEIKEVLFYWKYHKFRNEFQFAFEQWEIIQPICQALYAKNKRLFMLPYKRLHKDLKNLKPNIEKEMYSLIRGKNTPSRIKKKIKIVEKIIGKLELD